MAGSSFCRPCCSAWRASPRSPHGADADRPPRPAPERRPRPAAAATCWSTRAASRRPSARQRPRRHDRCPAGRSPAASRTPSVTAPPAATPTANTTGLADPRQRRSSPAGRPATPALSADRRRLVGRLGDRRRAASATTCRAGSAVTPRRTTASGSTATFLDAVRQHPRQHGHRPGDQHRPRQHHRVPPARLGHRHAAGRHPLHQGGHSPSPGPPGSTTDGYADDLSLTLSAAVPTPALTAPPSSVPGYDHVFVVYMENENYEDIIGNTSQAPYINSLASANTVAQPVLRHDPPQRPELRGAGRAAACTG